MDGSETATRRTRILVVDDDPLIRDLLTRVLSRSGYAVDSASSAEQALDNLPLASCELVISDIKMPGMDGLDFAARLHITNPDIPVVLITGHGDAQLMRTALRQGVSDFISKPFQIESVPLIVERNLERRRLGEIRMQQMDEAVMLSAVQALAAAIDAKERFTAEHSRRVSRISVAIGDRIGLSATERRHLELSALVHDVGKIGTPDSVLNKPGRLDEEEWKIIRRHPEIGAEIVGRIPQLSPVADVVRHHHERVDGGGYPAGLIGDDIPFLSRIIAVADAFEVMTADRVYRSRFTDADAMIRLNESSGTQFDREIVTPFVSLSPELLR